MVPQWPELIRFRQMLNQAVEKSLHMRDASLLRLHLISFSFEATYFPQGNFLKLWPFNLGEQQNNFL